MIEKWIDSYFELEEKIFKEFGYEEDWRRFPIVDSRDDEWYFTGHSVIFHETLTPEIIESMDYYQNEVYTYRHLDKYVYHVDELTMMLVATGCDGNIYLQIFDNNKEVDSID